MFLVTEVIKEQAKKNKGEVTVIYVLPIKLPMGFYWFLNQF